MAEPAPLNANRAAPVVSAEQARGRSRRNVVSRSTQGAWAPVADRPDPIAIIEATNDGRVADLVPIRHGRMMVSPFAFLRGSAAVMAADLASTPSTGLRVQACGDAHLSNFGVFATPERNLVFGLNDFDETLPGPWEWDIKRLAASLVVVAREIGAPRHTGDDAVRAAARSYREHLVKFAGWPHLDVWYASVDVSAVAVRLRRDAAKQSVDKVADKARKRTNLNALAKLTETVDGRRQIVDDPPLLVRLADDSPETLASLEMVRRHYRASVSPALRQLLDRYTVVDVARKVVGVGSVGTRTNLVLLTGTGDDNPLFLQVKEAVPSVLEPYLGRSRYRHAGRRVVEGQHLMQAASDIFLGWATAANGVQFYVRQLRDMKGSVNPSTLSASGLCDYADVCGWALARAHARSGEGAAIAGYLGGSDRFDTALARFARSYADQTEHDHAAFLAAVKAGRLPADPDH